MDPLTIFFAAAAGWTGDDWCPTPPRPPWPWPWFLRKLLAVIGGIAVVYLIVQERDGGPSNYADWLTIGLAGIIGGATLASVVGGLGGSLGARTVNVDRTGP